MRSLGVGERVALAVLGIAAAAGLLYGWHLFWFLTDDAHIAFRYVSNSLAGHGYVWNPPPFRPVEGFTSFLWVALLDAVWRLTGVEPPAAANVLSLVYAGLTLVVGVALALGLPWSERLRPARVPVVGLVLLGVLTNRTFLAWTSSGLETAMFNFHLTLWIAACLCLELERRGAVATVSASALLVYLSRPDGMLVVAATAALLPLALALRRPRSRPALGDLLAAAPLLGVPLHLLWRRSTYGEWLPNTFFAKTNPGRLWLESGARYLLSFVIEYALWLWLAALLLVLLRALSGVRATGLGGVRQAAAVPRTWARLAVLAVVLGQLLYYTAVVGGDHFEFRVYSHLILLAFVTFPLLLDRLGARAPVVAATTVAFVALSWPIPWVHWALSQRHVRRAETRLMTVPVAPAIARALPWIPASLLSVVRLYDDQQAWLISHAVGSRHQEHKVFYLGLAASLPSRADGLAFAPTEAFPVTVQSSVGVVGWVLPRVNVVDRCGLNDWVIARNPHLKSTLLMAHQRQPPPGYVACFMPNVSFAGKTIAVSPRPEPLTAARIVECERRGAALVGADGS